MTYKSNSRRNFLKTLTTTTLISGYSLSRVSEIVDINRRDISSGPSITGTYGLMDDPRFMNDGPPSPFFNPLDITGNVEITKIDSSVLSAKMSEAIKSSPTGNCVAWGIPFNIREHIICIKDKPFISNIKPCLGKWMVFLHTSDQYDLKINKDGFYEKPFKGIGMLNENLANYVIIYEDGSEVTLPIRQRHQIGMFQQSWGENCIESVANIKPRSLEYNNMTSAGWGTTQTRIEMNDRGTWINWLWAWENKHPEKPIKALRIDPLTSVPFILFGISVGDVSSNPLRWESRQKAIVSLSGEVINLKSEEKNIFSYIKLDLGQVISVQPRKKYPDQDWHSSYNNKIPENYENEIIVEYTAHPDAMFHMSDLGPISISGLKSNSSERLLRLIKSANKSVRIRVIEKKSGKVVPVKFHAHGESGEYLAPVDRHRQPNIDWFEDYSVDFVHRGSHSCTYITGETLINLPLGRVYIEISKGFEITPVRKVVEIFPNTETVTIEIEKALFWREKGWVTADTHVHFLSPGSAILEGNAEGVNVVNLLASQWGELMTNVGDFDGKTTYGSKILGGDGEYLVRVGTENRQHVMGHISLLGYEGNIIAPMTTGGPDESAIGDPIEMLLTEWAMQCKKQNGIVVLPHFPNPRLENAATIVSGNADAVEMTSWDNLYRGIDPYSLTDWYRYLNCGYFVAAVGGTDKMSARTAVGTVRTYAKISDDKEFSYNDWKESIKQGNTFVTYGPLIEFNVDGKHAGSQINMPSSGGTVCVNWEVASVTTPMTRVELIVNGEVRESASVSLWEGSGSWNLKISGSSWIALLVRGKYHDKPEIIAAHTSPVMIWVKGSAMLSALDALTILDQIEGAMAYLDTIGTRAHDQAFKRMKMVLTSAHRIIHNRMHEAGYFHQHTPTNEHSEHNRD